MKSCVVSIGAFGIALTLVAAQAIAQDGPVKLGVLTDMSSLYADNGGQGSVIAAQIAVDDFGGQVRGRSIQVIAGDHQNKADVGSTIAGRWLENENVEVVLDVPNSVVALAVQGITRDKKKLFLATGAATSPPHRRRMLADRDSLDLRHLRAISGNDAGDVAPRREVLVLHLGKTILLGPNSKPTAVRSSTPWAARSAAP